MGSVTFWWIATIMVVACAAVVVLPLYLRRFPNYRDRPALRWLAPALAVAILLPLSAVGLYSLLGSPGALGHEVPPPPPSDHARPGDRDGGDLESATARLKERLAAHPDDPDGWRLLAQSYEFMGRADLAADARSHIATVTGDDLRSLANSLPTGNTATQTGLDTATLIANAESDRRARRFAQALEAFAELERRRAMNADLWADYADALGASRGKLDDAAARCIDQALALDPDHAKALWLRGSLQTDRRDFRGALATWRKLASLLPPDSSDAKLIAANIEEARTALGGSASTTTADDGPAPASPSVRGNVRLPDDLRARVAPNAVLFVFARAVGETGPPLAVLREPVGRWPVAFVLDDRAAMIPSRKLSSFSRVIVEARVSNSGMVSSAPDDLHAVSQVIDPRSARPLDLVLAAPPGGG